MSSINSKIVLLGDAQPIECPVCRVLLRDREDVKSVHKEDACSECVINFKYLYSTKWASGWRPSVDDARKKRCIFS